MDEAVDLYETDLIRWAEDQARALRAAGDARVNLPIDWEHVAEEIESLGRSQRTELRSRLTTVIEHLLKLAYSPASDPRDGWRSTIRRERNSIEALLDDNRSLVREVPALIEWATPRASDLVAMDLADRLEADEAILNNLRARRFSEAEILGNWFPEPPSRS